MGRFRGLGSVKSFFLMCSSALWGQCPVLSHPELPQGSSQRVAAAWGLLDGRYSFLPVFPQNSPADIRAVIADDCDILCILMWQAIFHLSIVVESLARKTKNVRVSTEMSYLKRRFGSVKGVSHRKLMNGGQFKHFPRPLSEIYPDLKAEQDLQRLGNFIPIIWCLHPKRRHWKITWSQIGQSPEHQCIVYCSDSQIL